MVPYLYQVFIEGIFIEGGFPNVNHLQWLAILENCCSIALNWQY